MKYFIRKQYEVREVKKTLWTRDFTRITLATTLGAAGGIISGFALSFLVFDETGSTMAAALTVALQFFPGLILPLLIAPLMDRLPRKPFLVGGDLVNGVLYAAAGLLLRRFPFSYTAYLGFSLLLSCLGTFDELAYNSIYPQILPKGMEEKGYTVSSMLYPVLKVVMTPVAAALFQTVGVANILLIQSAFSISAALIESRIQVPELPRGGAERFSVRRWWADLREAAAYLRQEKGLRALFVYSAVTNGMAYGYSPLLVAFFRVTAGFSAAMYSLFSVVEFAGRSLGGAVRYRWSLKPEKRFGFIFMVYQIYETMDACLLWLPYPLMLANRAVCGFLGINSATIREAAVQSYLPEQLRARINAFSSVLFTIAGTVLSLAVGALGEVLDYRVCMTICGLVTMGVCWLTVFHGRAAVKDVLHYQEQT